MPGVSGEAIVEGSVPEGSNIEVAHQLHERGEEAEEHRKPRSDLLIEIAEAVLLAIVAIATAWSGYQSAKWDGESAKLYGTSSRIRFQATQNETRGGQQQLYDALTFDFWLSPKLSGNQQLAADYQKRFRPEYRPAFRAWLATDPFNNPNAPPGPIFMPQYKNALLIQSATQDKTASATFVRAVDARETGDKYVRTTVLLATVLFLIAVSQRFGLFKVRVGLFVVSLVLLGLALSSIATYPRL
jgi:hypothetical protein